MIDVKISGFIWWAIVAFTMYLVISSFFAASAEFERISGLKEVCEAQGGQFLAGQYGTHVCFPEKVFK